MINYFEISDVIALHNSVIDVSGGSCGINDISLLSSALTHIQNDGYYPEFIDKLTHLMFACIKFHPFKDGNKRSAIILGMYFLELNDLYFEEFAIKMEDVVVSVASDEISKDKLGVILKKFN